MINHLRPHQETQLRPYLAKTLILQGFRPPKNATFSAFLPYFLYVLEALTTSYITKKRRNPYIYCVLEPYHFSL